MKKLLISMMAVVIAMTSLTGCASKTVTNPETTKTLDKMVMTYVTSPLNVPSIVDEKQGIFTKKMSELGTKVEYVEITSGADQTQALASGDVQVLYAVGATSVVLSAANGADIKVLNTYSRSPEAFCVYAKDETITSPEDLRGKKIAGPVGTNLHELISAYLATADMTLDDVEFVNMTIPDTKAALDGGSIDVALLAGATAYQAQQQGYHLVTNGKGLIDAIIAVAVTEEFYNEYPEVIKAIMESQEEIAAYMKENSEEAISMVATSLDLDEKAVNEMIQYYDFSTEVTDADKTGLQKTADFMLESGMIETEVDVNELFFQ